MKQYNSKKYGLRQEELPMRPQSPQQTVPQEKMPFDNQVDAKDLWKWFKQIRQLNRDALQNYRSVTDTRVPFEFPPFPPVPPFPLNDDPREPKPYVKPPTPSHGNLPRPLARTRWNWRAGQFGELQGIWDALPDEWKQELAGFPQDAVKDLLSLKKLADAGSAVIYNGKWMAALEAFDVLKNQLREVAAQIDQNYVQAKERVKARAEYRDKVAEATPLLGRIAPQVFGT